MITRLAALAIAVTVSSGVAIADPQPSPDAPHQVIHSPNPITLRADTGEELRVPPGYYLPEPVWQGLDLEVKRLQESETRLKAENRSLRDSASTAGPGWGTVALVLGGIAAGVAMGYAL